MAPRPLNGLSLCAGAGGLDMGLMLAEPSFHTRCFVEWDEYPRASIIAAQNAGYFAPAPIWDDVTTFDGRPFRGAIDTILAGYPCQPFSHAGQRRGSSDERHLWPDIARIIREVRPTWVFLENVAGHVTLGLETVLRELRDMGFTVATGLFSAGETGAAHERLRVFIVAYSEGERTGEQNNQVSTEPWENARRCSRGRGLRSNEPEMANAKGFRRRLHSGPRAEGSGTTHSKRSSGQLADASGPGFQGGERCGSPGEGREGAHGSASKRSRPRLHPPGPSEFDAWSAIIGDAPYLAPSVSLSDVKRAADHYAALVAQGELAEAEAERIVRGMADGMANRTRALRLLGNGVHPVAAGYAWRSLSASLGLRPLDLGAASFHPAA